MQDFGWVTHSMVPPILTTQAKPDVTMTIIHILKTSISRKTIVGNFMEVFGSKKQTQKHIGLPLY